MQNFLLFLLCRLTDLYYICWKESFNKENMQLIDGKAISEQVKQEIAAEVAEIVAKGGKRPHLAAILVGHDGGSETYVAAKVKACEVCGFKSSLIRYEADVTEEELLAKVRELNEDADVDGFIVQLPLPKHISEQKVIETIDYRKDVDGFHPINVGRMSIGLPCYVSATPNGILELLKRYNIETQGKKCVVLGRSNIVGKPMAMLMMQKSYPGKKEMQIIGLAKGYAEALELVCSIIEEVYQNTGDVDVKSYLRGRKRRRQV